MHSKRVTLRHIIKLSKDKENFEISKTNDRNPQSDYEMSHQKPRIQDGNMLDTFKMLKKKNKQKHCSLEFYIQQYWEFVDMQPALEEMLKSVWLKQKDITQ